MKLCLKAAVAAVAVAAILVVCAAPARAQDDSLNRARDAFDKAQALFESGKYADAASQFQAAYQARPFAQFLFNIGACYEKLRDYGKAASYYRRYLQAEPNAPDRAKTEKRVAALEKAVAQVKAAKEKARAQQGAAGTGGTAGTGTTGTDTGTGGTSGAGTGTAGTGTGGTTGTGTGGTAGTDTGGTAGTGTAGTGTAGTGTTDTATATPASPPPAVAGLEDPTPRGLIVIESEPEGANIYLDSKKKKPLSKTPWNGTLDGEHLIMLEREGYKPVERRITPDQHKLIILFWGLAEEDYLGWVDITSNPPGANIYIDNRQAGVYQHTPYQGNLTPGTHTIWINAEGYDDYVRTIKVVAGETQKLDARLKGSPVGYLNIRGGGLDRVSVYVDGKVACPRAPCRFPVHQGNHKVSVKRDGYKSYTTDLDMQAKTEVTLRANLAPEPSRTDAVVAYIVAAAFTGGAIWSGLQAQSIHDDLQKDIDAGAPPPDKSDPRFLRGKIYAVGADVGYVIGGASLLAAIYYTFRDKGPASTGAADAQALSGAERSRSHPRSAVRFNPAVGPGYAGLGMEVRW